MSTSVPRSLAIALRYEPAMSWWCISQSAYASSYNICDDVVHVPHDSICAPVDAPDYLCIGLQEHDQSAAQLSVPMMTLNTTIKMDAHVRRHYAEQLNDLGIIFAGFQEAA
eukprot:10123677-Karenia_brevis.AAC.1